MATLSLISTDKYNTLFRKDIFIGRDIKENNGLQIIYHEEMFNHPLIS
jgi:hypothetical protein